MKINVHWLRRPVTCWVWAFCLTLLVMSACAPTVSPASVRPELVAAVPRGALSAALAASAEAYAGAGGMELRIEALNSKDYTGQVNAALLAGLDRYDLVYLPAEDLPRWAGYNALQPLAGDENRPAAQPRLLQQPWLPAVTVAGRRYGLPTQPDPLVLWYRADLLQAAGLPVPAGWEALREAARSLDARPNRSGMIVAGSDIDAGADFAAVLAGFRGEMVSEQYQVQFNGEAVRRALEFYTSLPAAPGAEHVTRADVLAALRDGRSALGIAPFSAGATLQDCAASPNVCSAGKPLLAWARLPGLEAHQAVGSLDAWAVPLRSAHPEQAQRFIAWLGSAEGALAWAQAGGTPAHTGVLAGLEGAHPLAQVTEYRLAFPPVSTVDLLWKACNKAVHTTMAAAKGGPAGEKQAIDRVLEEAAGEMREALRRAGYKSEE